MTFTITPEQAISVLPDGDKVHTFRVSGGMMLGGDWGRADVQASIQSVSEVDLCGPVARGMGHGIAITHDGRQLFIATDEARLSELEIRLEDKEPA